MGQAVWGKKTGPALEYSSFSPSICCPSAGCCFLTSFNVLFRIMDGTAGMFERISQFSQACTVFVLEVKGHPQDPSGSWVGLSVCFQGCFCFSCQNFLGVVDP